MKELSQILVSIQDIINKFDGTVSIKNAHRRYFFVNDLWLNTVKLERAQVINKTDDEILPTANADFVRKTDLEVAEKKAASLYFNKALINDTEITYIAIKWVVYYQTGEPFCYCTIAHLQEEKEKVIALQSKISSILDAQITQTDYTNTSFGEMFHNK